MLQSLLLVSWREAQSELSSFVPGQWANRRRSLVFPGLSSPQVDTISLSFAALQLEWSKAGLTGDSALASVGPNSEGPNFVKLGLSWIPTSSFMKRWQGSERAFGGSQILCLWHVVASDKSLRSLLLRHQLCTQITWGLIKRQLLLLLLGWGLEVRMFSKFPSDAVAVGPVPGIHYVGEALEKRTRETEAARNL